MIYVYISNGRHNPDRWLIFNCVAVRSKWRGYTDIHFEEMNIVRGCIPPEHPHCSKLIFWQFIMVIASSMLMLSCTLGVIGSALRTCWPKREPFTVKSSLLTIVQTAVAVVWLLFYGNKVQRRFLTLGNHKMARIKGTSHVYILVLSSNKDPPHTRTHPHTLWLLFREQRINRNTIKGAGLLSNWGHKGVSAFPFRVVSILNHRCGFIIFLWTLLRSLITATAAASLCQRAE